eukprot:TRINITY_DN21314_c0_g1_i1.p1 TRINITY_DN21314_c0_g1~~TRINITY_DN21314_c0_g1_i1.p1  ORF type:complete len:172 (+),score=38.87 TRINITY_DN21314_c0_g1_i1:197-712(+)
MTTIRRFSTEDLFRFNNVNLDELTETYNIPFYLQYLGRWPELCMTAESANGDTMGYFLGKSEGQGENWHGHVTAVTVDPAYRRLGIAQHFMSDLEQKSDKMEGYFVDLFVRLSNTVAINMYKKLGYSIYRHIYGYYSGEEDAYDMRKALTKDVDKKSIVPLPHPVYPDEVD